MNKNDSMLSSYLAALHAEYSTQKASVQPSNGSAEKPEEAKAPKETVSNDPPAFASAPETVDALSSSFDLLDPDLDTESENLFTLTVAERKPADEEISDIDLVASIDAAFADPADEKETSVIEKEELNTDTGTVKELPEETAAPAEEPESPVEEVKEQPPAAEEAAPTAPEEIPLEQEETSSEENASEPVSENADDKAEDTQEEEAEEIKTYETETKVYDEQQTEPASETDSDLNNCEAAAASTENFDFSAQADEPVYFRRLPGIAQTEDKNAGDASEIGSEKIVVEGSEPTRPVEIKTKPKEGLIERDALVVSIKSGEVSDNSDRIKIYTPDDAPKSGYERRGDKPVVNPDLESDAQLTFSNFPGTAEPETISEDVLAEQVLKNRQEFVENFTLENQEEPGKGPENEPGKPDEPFFTKIRNLLFPYVSTNLRLNKPDVEYTSQDKFATVFADRKGREIGTLVCTAVTAILTLVLMITVGSSNVAEKIGYTQGSGLPKSYIVSLVLIIFSFAFGFIVMSDGLTNIKRSSFKTNAKTPLLVSGAVAIVQNIFSMILWNGTKTLVVLYTPAASFALFLGCLGCLLSDYDTEKNFHFLRRRERYTIHTVKAATAQTDAARPRSDGIVHMPNTICSGKTKFADKFVAYSTSDNSMDDLSSKLLVIALAFSFVIAVFAGIKNKSFSSALSIFSGALCMGIPAGALIAINLPLTLINNHLRQDGAMITSYAAAYETEDKKEVLVDAAGLFPERSYTFDNVQSYGNVLTAEAVRIAASILSYYDTPLGRFFKHKVMKDNGLVKISEVVYEDKQGLTGWVENRKICLGNSELMRNHNVEIPIDAREEDLTKGGKKVLYLSDNETLIAVFTLTYRAGDRIGEYLKKITERGMSIAVCTCDPNITEEYIASAYHISLNSVRVVHSTEALRINEFSSTSTEKEDAKIIHNGSPVAYLRSINSAGMLCSISRFTGYSQLFFCLIFLLITLILTFVGNIMSSGVVIFCSLIGTLLCSVIGFITKD